MIPKYAIIEMISIAKNTPKIIPIIFNIFFALSLVLSVITFRLISSTFSVKSDVCTPFFSHVFSQQIVL